MFKRILIPLIIIAMVAFGASSCGAVMEEPIYNGYPDDMVAYYGCPNSRKVKKLNLMKRLLKK